MSVLFGFTGPSDESLLEQMARAVSHRGDASLQSSERLSFGGTIIEERGSICVAVAGTVVYPKADLIELYQQDRLQELRGSFVMAIRDGDSLILFRDGAGRRTVYWGRHQDRILFSIEPKGIYTISGFERKLRPGAVAQYLTFSFVPGIGTMLENVFELPAGHLLRIEPNREPELQRWFVPETIEEESRSEEEWIEEFREIHTSAIDELREPGKPAAVFLSGGIDSSVVTAELAKFHDGLVNTYSIHFGKKLPNELEFAKMVADRCGTNHHEVLIEPKDFVPRLGELIWHLDEPIGDPVTMPNFELAKRVGEQGFRGVFNGEGGDPLFGGPKNLPMLMGHWYGGVNYDKQFRERAYLASYRRGYEEIQYLLTPEFREKIDEERDLVSMLSPFFNANEPASFLDKLTAINLRLKGAHLILPKVERMMASIGMTPLSPLFDERMVRLAFRLPGPLKLKNGIEKIVMKRAYENDLPQLIIDRPKSGMRVPVYFWFRKEMKRFVRKLLNHKTIENAGIFDWKRIDQLMRYETDEGPGRYGIRLWMLMTFEYWRRMVFEEKSWPK